MGGYACLVPWRSIVRFDSFPTHQKDQKALEEQMRAAFLVPSIYTSVEDRGHGHEVCELLEKKKLNETELRRMYELGEPPYDESPVSG